MASEVEEFLEQYSPKISALSAQLRRFISEIAPDCSESLHMGWKVIPYGYGKKFCAIAPHAKWVHLQFHAGAALSDTHALRKGTGKSMRHARIATGSDSNANLASLVRQASKLAE